MSNANVDLIKSLYAAFARNEIAPIIAALAPDVSWQFNGRTTDYPLFEARKGPAGVQEFFRLLAEFQDVIEFSPREFYGAENKVFVLGHYAWKLRKSGQTVESDWVHVFTFKNSKVAEFREFTDTARFAEAYRS